MAVLYSDDFNRSNGALPADWLTTYDGGGAAPANASNQMETTAGAYSSAHVTTVTPANDQWAQVTFVNGFAGPGVRMSGTSYATLDWYGYFSHGSVQKMVNSSQSTLGSCTATTAGDDLKFMAAGTSLQPVRNGTPDGSPFTDATLTSGTIGVVLYASTSKCDDFSGGDFYEVSSIGTSSRDYSTLQAWEDACPANLVSDGVLWKGEVYNDSEFYSASANLLSIAGITADASRYLWLTVADGESFQDHADVRTNPLTYDQSKGVGLRTDTGYANGPITITSVVHCHFDRLQLKCATSAACIAAAAQIVFIDSVLGQHDTRIHVFIGLGSSSVVTNSVAYVNNANTGLSYTGVISGYYGTPRVHGCTIVRNPSHSAGGNGIYFSTATLVTNTAIFGFTTAIGSSVHGSSGNNATDLGSLSGSNNKVSVTFSATTPFTQAGASGNDLRTIRGTALGGGGAYDGTYSPFDISLTAHPTVSTIGAWQIDLATETSTIGTTGRDYSTVQAWEDACPASLLEWDWIWRGECYNDSEFTTSTYIVDFSGITTSAVNNIALVCAAGESFRDHVDAATNALKYDASLGVGFRGTGASYSGAMIRVSVGNITFSGIQVQPAVGTGNGCMGQGSLARNVRCENMIFEQMSISGYTVTGAYIDWSFQNCVFIHRRTGGASGSHIQFSYATNATIQDCTFVACSDTTSSGSAILGTAGAVAVTNCAFFGFTTVKSGTTTFTFTTCASDVASPPSGVTGSVTYADQFEDIANSTRDFRTKNATSGLAGQGTYSASYPTDIIGQPRFNPQSIGAWEVAPVVVTSTIGTTGRDYSTLQAWEDAGPASLVAANKIWEGHCYNDSEFSSATSLLAIGGITTSTTRYINLTTGPGQSFIDHAGAATNPLRYDQSKGVGLKNTGGYSICITTSVANCRISKLQINDTSSHGNSGPIRPQGYAPQVTDCLIDGDCGALLVQCETGTYRNCVFIARRSTGTGVVASGSYALAYFYNCTMVCPDDITSSVAAIYRSFGTSSFTLVNCAIFGFADVTNHAASCSGSYNATDLSAVGFGTNNQVSLTYADQFENVNNATRDFRVKAGADLIGAGTYDAAYSTDIIGQTRANPPTIGAWEYILLVLASGGAKIKIAPVGFV